MSLRERWARHWHGEVPAVRLAAFRTLLGLFLLAILRPLLRDDLVELARYDFHHPFVAGLPAPPPVLHPAIDALLGLAAVGLVLGVAVRASAWTACALGLWIVLVDQAFYKHNVWLTILLLFLVGLGPADRVRLWDLVSGGARAVRRVAWPEALVRAQLAIVFGYGAVHKVVSADWGLGGERLHALANGKTALVALAPLDAANDLVLGAVPGAASVFVAALEAAIFVLLLRPRPWWATVGLLAGFAAYIEFMLQPLMFAWILAAAALLWVPAGEPAVRLAVERGCARCARRRRGVAALDWLGRVGDEPAAPGPGGACGGLRVTHADETLAGLRAAVRLAFVAVTPVLLLVSAAGSFGLQWRTAFASSTDGLVAGALVAAALGAWDLRERARAGGSG